MKNWAQEFKEFINRGNLVEIAVAFVLATAFKPVVDRIVDGVIMPIIAAIFGQPDFDDIVIDVGDAEILIGTVITAIVSFLLIALVCFFLVKAYNRFRRPTVEEAAEITEVELLTEIRELLRRQG